MIEITEEQKLIGQYEALSEQCRKLLESLATAKEQFAGQILHNTSRAEVKRELQLRHEAEKNRITAKLLQLEPQLASAKNKLKTHKQRHHDEL